MDIFGTGTLGGVQYQVDGDDFRTILVDDLACGVPSWPRFLLKNPINTIWRFHP